MHRIIGVLAALGLCAAFAVANPSGAAAFGHGGGGFGHGWGGGFHGGFGGFHGGFGGFHGGLGFHGFRGFYGGYGGGYYAPYFDGDDYPYSLYEDEGPDCHFVWVRRTVNHRVVRHGIWTCL
jgi:hypothetical protein